MSSLDQMSELLPENRVKLLTKVIGRPILSSVLSKIA